MTLYERLTEPPRQSFSLLGMRGTGKSTWARAAFPGAVYLDLLDERHQALPGLVRQGLVYTGPRAFRSGDGIDIWPAARFAAAADGRLWP